MPYNSINPKGGLSFSKASFELVERFLHRINNYNQNSTLTQSPKTLPVLHPMTNKFLQKKTIQILFLVGAVFFQTKLGGQDMGWYTINTTPYMLSRSPFDVHSDCNHGLNLGGIPSAFSEHLVTDSMFISKDLKNIRLVCRYFGNLEQIDSNDLGNYTLLKDTNYRTYYNDKRVKYLKKGDSLYFFNFINWGTLQKNTDTIVLYRAINVQNGNNCNNNFPFGDCPYRSIDQIMNDRLVWASKGKMKVEHPTNCYKVTEFKKLKNNAKQFSIIVPLSHSYIGSGKPYVELHEYLKTWNGVLNIFFKPLSGSYNLKEKLWVIEYDTANNFTKGFISIYNGGMDTMFLRECSTTAGNAIINGYPNFIAPASWGVIKLEFLHGNKPYTPKNSTINIRTSNNISDNNYQYYPLHYRIQ